MSDHEIAHHNGVMSDIEIVHNLIHFDNDRTACSL